MAPAARPIDVIMTTAEIGTRPLSLNPEIGTAREKPRGYLAVAGDVLLAAQMARFATDAEGHCILGGLPICHRVPDHIPVRHFGQTCGYAPLQEFGHVV